MVENVLDAHPNSRLGIKEEFRDENGNLDMQQLFDDFDQYSDDDSDIDAIKRMRHELQRRVEFVGGYE